MKGQCISKKAKLIGDLAPHNRWWGMVTRAWAQVYETGGVIPCIPSTYANHAFKIVDDREKDKAGRGPKAT